MRIGPSVDVVDRGAGPIGRPVVRGVSHHSLEVVSAGAVPLCPRREDVAVSVLGHPTGEGVLLVEQGGERHVTAIAGSEYSDAVGIDPVQPGEILAGGDAVGGVTDAPVVVVGPLEGQPVGR